MGHELARETGAVLPPAFEVDELMERMRIAGRREFDHAGFIPVETNVLAPNW